MFQIKQHNSFNTQHIRMISEGSCDNEDWSNDAENSDLLHSSGSQPFFFHRAAL